MELKKNCGTKATEFDERAKIRAEELVAISETIKVCPRIAGLGFATTLRGHLGSLREM